jgi:excisionase family DNA binding protein
VTRPAGADQTLTLIVPDELLQAAAERIAELVLAQAATRSRVDSPWLDFEAAIAYLGFSRDKLYKLTAARAIPFHKKRDGHGLLFHRGELDRWLEQEYPSTGCGVEVELWSSTT